MFLPMLALPHRISHRMPVIYPMTHIPRSPVQCSVSQCKHHFEYVASEAMDPVVRLLRSLQVAELSGLRVQRGNVANRARVRWSRGGIGTGTEGTRRPIVDAGYAGGAAAAIASNGHLAGAVGEGVKVP